MRDRNQLILRIACLALAGLVVYQISRTVLRLNPLTQVSIPAVPTLVDTNAAASAQGTNAPAGTNRMAGSRSGTNTPAASSKGTNTIADAAAGTTNAASVTTNTAAGTNLVASTGTSTNAVTGTNAATATAELRPPASTNAAVATTNLTATIADTNQAVGTVGTNVLTTAASTNIASTNLLASGGTNVGGTNLIAAVGGTNAAGRPPGARPGMPPGMAMSGSRGGPGGSRGPPLPPPVQARVSRILESEIFGAIPRPMPMALLGIAGNSAVIRTPSGQTGWVKEGDSLGEIKLLKIGMNRVLVEENGQSRELMIFSGMGGETLLPKTKETPNETTSK